VLSSFVLLSFYLLSLIIGIDNTFLILLPIYSFLTIIAYLKIGFTNFLSKRSIAFSALIAFLSFGIVLLFPPNKINEWYTIIILQGLREEMYFRFCALGLMKTCSEWIRSKLAVKVLIMLINAALFTLLHIQYQTLPDYLTIFLVSIIFAYLFIENGIMSAIVAHSLWNFYLSLYPLIPLIVLSIINKNFRAIRKNISNAGSH